MPAPHEVVASSPTVWVAPVGTAFPELDDSDATVAATAWDKLGVAGDSNYDDSGVSISHNEETSDFTPVGTTMPTKRFRVSESFLVKLNLVDISPETYAVVMNDATVTTVAPGAGIPGEKYFSLYRGDQVNQFAVLVRGMSSVDNDLVMDYRFSKAFVSVNGDVVYKKGDPAALAVEILAVRTSASDLIECHVQTADAS